ncbi:Uncharacterised protein [Kluyvera cryocrescens]|uniref:Uncharacterized protein n=1 Tax=Kluyvera cryocrescens TaxID=580 RepID=A0A485BPD1_KLUCR|nr:Uncharacterised protein [Kluyvera cryocrescens]
MALAQLPGENQICDGGTRRATAPAACWTNIDWPSLVARPASAPRCLICGTAIFTAIQFGLLGPPVNVVTL